MAVEELKARLTLDVSPFESGSKRAKTQLEDLEKGTKKAAGGAQDLERAVGTRLTSALGALGGALSVTALVAGFTAALKMGVDEVTEAERAVMKLTAVFDGQTAAVGRMMALAETLAGKTLFFEDDQIQAAIATFRLFDVGEQQIQKLLPAVMDMATVMGMDLDQAVQKVGLGLMGQTRGLKQWGIVVQEGASAQEIMNAVLAKAAGFHDQAAKAGDTLTGKLAGLKKATHDAAESMANALKPTLETIVDAFTDAARAAKSFFDQLAVNREGLYTGSAGAKKVALPGLEGAAGATPLPAGSMAAAAAGVAAMLAGGGLVIPGEAPPSSGLPAGRRGGAGGGTGRTGGAATTPRPTTAPARAPVEEPQEPWAGPAWFGSVKMADPFTAQVEARLRIYQEGQAKETQLREQAAQRGLAADRETRQISIGLAKEGFAAQRALVEQWFADESDLYKGQNDTIESLRRLREVKLTEIGKRETDALIAEVARGVATTSRIMRDVTLAQPKTPAERAEVEARVVKGLLPLAGAGVGFAVGGPVGAAVGGAAGSVLGDLIDIVKTLWRPAAEDQSRANAEEFEAALKLSEAATAQERASRELVESAEIQRRVAEESQRTGAGIAMEQDLAEQNRMDRLRLAAKRGAPGAEAALRQAEGESGLRKQIEQYNVGYAAAYGGTQGGFDLFKLMAEQGKTAEQFGQIVYESTSSWTQAEASARLYQFFLDQMALLAPAAGAGATPAVTPAADMSGRSPDRPLYVEVTNMPPASPFAFAPGSRFFRGGSDVTTRAAAGPQNVITGSTGGRGAPLAQVTGGTPLISRSGGTARGGGTRR